MESEQPPSAPAPILPEEIKKEEATQIAEKVQPEYKMPTNEKGSNALVYFGLFLVIVLILGFLGWKYVFGEKLMGQFFPASTSTLTTLTGESPTKKPVSTNSGEMANWKIYKNEKWGFEVKYPPEEFTVSQVDGYLTTVNRTVPAMQAIVFMGFQNNKNLDFLSWVKEQSNSSTEEILVSPHMEIRATESTINNYKQYNLPEGMLAFVPSGYFYYANILNDKIILIGSINLDYPKYKNLISQILSTFRFVEKSPSVSVAPVATGSATQSAIPK
jgi:hypothetical protein